jgi:predicted dehydrogenase/threonine dehydrogenase-like Zn-dependent dehydrogenase
MKQVLISRGQAAADEVPAPAVEPGTVLVRVRSSCVSSGTELSGLASSGVPLWKRALAQPEKVKRVFESVATVGVPRTWDLVTGQLATGNPTGYSAAGVVEEVGEGVTDLKPGDRVACAGAQFAHHAEIIRVPRNLTVLVPEGVDLEEASVVTLGAIALQGVRRATPTLGETFVVIGLGLLGQLTVQLLRANGCRVIGTDLDRSRIAKSLELGAEAGLHPEDGDTVAQVTRLTGGIGADGVIITAATSSDAVVSQAFKMCRRKGRVVLVGDVGLNLKRGDFYQKEIDFFISTSYGPGRYDANYEEGGQDYPIGYVRWTENRNMAEFLRLIGDGSLQVKPLISAVFPISEAGDAYQALQKQDGERPMMVLLSYPETQSVPVRRLLNPVARAPRTGTIGVALIGAGGFAKGMHLPNLQTLRNRFHLRAVASRTGHNAMATAKQWGAAYATTEFEQVLADKDVDAVIIATPHQMHADMALRALQAGKHVLVEKPLALEADELARITEWIQANARQALPVLMTGFNRRFSPYGRRISEIVRGRTNPMIINYRMNAGYIPLDHSLHKEQGGRNRGEACHIYDLFTFLTDSRMSVLSAQAIRPATGHYSGRDNFVMTASFTDGSVATLTYTALGTSGHPKEAMEVFVDGKVVALEDYQRLTVVGAKGDMTTPRPEKGQLEELDAFANAITRGTHGPIPLWQQVQATEMALDVDTRLMELSSCAE